MQKIIPLLLCIIALSACRKSGMRSQKAQPASKQARQGPVQVVKLRSAEKIPRGLRCSGKRGDYLLRNRKIFAVIDKKGRLIDFGPLSGGDLLSRMTAAIDLGAGPIKVRYNRAMPGNVGKSRYRVIRAYGIVPGTKLKVITIYQLGADDRFLTMTSKIINRSRQRLVNVALGDYIYWGNRAAVVPGRPPIRRSGIVFAPWVARPGANLSYAYGAESGQVRLLFPISHRDYTTTVWGFGLSVDLKARQRIVYKRYLAIGTGGVLSAAAQLPFLASKSGWVRGSIQRSKKPVADAEVVVRQGDGSLYALGRAGIDGTFILRLPEGRYRLFAGGGKAGNSAEVLIKAGKTVKTELTLISGPKLKYRVLEKGQPVPARLIIKGILPTPAPRLNDRYSGEEAVGSVVFSPYGKGQLPLQAGRYRVVATRGPEYSIDEKVVDLKPGMVSEAVFNLSRVVDTKGFISSDLHLHTRASYDSAVSVRDRVISLAAENVEFAAATDHNAVIDLNPVVTALGLTRYLKVSRGTNISTRDDPVGHFILFDLPKGTQPFKYRQVAPEDIFRKARALDGEEILLIPHPWDVQSGYLYQFGLDSRTGKPFSAGYDPGFDALTVIDTHTAAAPEGLTQNLERYFELLNRGMRYTALGATGSHRLYRQEVGWPRTYLASSTDDPQKASPREMVASILARKATISLGIFVTMTAEGGKPIGSLVGAVGGRVTLNIRVQAPRWITVNRVELVENGKVIRNFPLAIQPGAERLKHRLTLSPMRDAWYLVRAYGNKPVSTLLGRTVLPFGMTNPIWVDRNLNGRFDGPAGNREGVTKRRMKREKKSIKNIPEMNPAAEKAAAKVKKARPEDARQPTRGEK